MVNKRLIDARVLRGRVARWIHKLSKKDDAQSIITKNTLAEVMRMIDKQKGYKADWDGRIID